MRGVRLLLSAIEKAPAAALWADLAFSWRRDVLPHSLGFGLGWRRLAGHRGEGGRTLQIHTGRRFHNKAATGRKGWWTSKGGESRRNPVALMRLAEDENRRRGEGSRETRSRETSEYIDACSDVKQAKNVEDLLRLCRAQEGEWHAEMTAQGFHRLKVLRREESNLAESRSKMFREVLQILDDHAMKTVKSFNPRHIGMLLNVHAVMLAELDKALFERLEEQILARIQDFQPQGISNCLWACAKLDILPREEVFTKIWSRAGAVVQDFKTQEIANFLGACAKLEMQPPEELYQRMFVRASGMTKDFKPQDISNLLWACAWLDVKPPDNLFNGMCGRAGEVIEDFKSQEIANLIWACATLGMQLPEVLFSKMCGRAGAVAQDFKPQGISNLMWACATLGNQPPDELFSRMCRRAGVVVQDFKPQEIANLMWACATLDMRPPEELFRKLCGKAGDVAEDFISQEIANLMWACAALGMQPPKELFNNLCSRAGAVIKEANPQEIANLMWACGTLDMRPSEELFGKIFDRVGAVAQQFKPQSIAMLLWACALFRCVLQGLRVLVAMRSALGDGMIRFHKWPVEDLRQMHQFLLTCELEVREALLSRGDVGLVRELQQLNSKHCLDAFISKLGTPSQLQKDVARVVAESGFDFQEEAIDSASGYSIDILVRKDGAVIAVEVDGPYHYLGEGRALKGSTLLKRRHLEQLGYRVVSVPYWEWVSLWGKAGKDAYIRTLIEGRKAPVASAHVHSYNQRLWNVFRGGHGRLGDSRDLGCSCESDLLYYDRLVVQT